jgi:hypothetical protein
LVEVELSPHVIIKVAERVGVESTRKIKGGIAPKVVDEHRLCRTVREQPPARTVDDDLVQIRKKSNPAWVRWEVIVTVKK